MILHFTGGISAALRSENGFEVSSQQIGYVKRLLHQFGKTVDYDVNEYGASSIISFYYECSNIRSDNNASVRQRPYLSRDLDDFS